MKGWRNQKSDEKHYGRLVVMKRGKRVMRREIERRNETRVAGFGCHVVRSIEGWGKEGTGLGGRRHADRRAYVME